MSTEEKASRTSALKGLLRAKDVAEALSVSPKAVYAWVSAGRLDCIRLSRRCIRFDPEAVTRFVEQASLEGAA